MSHNYGVTSAISDVLGGYEKEQGMQAESVVAGQKNEAAKLKLDKMRSEAEAEGSKDAVKTMLRGDLQGAMEKYNSQGKDKMSNLQFDQKEGVVSWENDQGDEQVVMLPQLMAMVGLDPNDLDTPDDKLARDKDLFEFKAKTKKKYGLGKGGKDKRTAYIQNLEYTMKNLTGGDAQKAFRLMQLSKSDPQTAYSRILIGLQKQNQEAFGEDKMTEDEMRKTAKDSVDSFREDMFSELFQKEQSPATDGQPAGNKDPLGLF